jgi:ABC-type glycerol-3-phosphate transport system substrate-binding protein
MPLNDPTQKVTRGRHAPCGRRAVGRGLIAGTVALVSLVVVASGVSRPTSGSAGKAEPITVWSDSIRLPAFKMYQKAHPNVDMKIVTWDGDGNGPATLQTKLNLFNRTGKGWPDVVFSQNPQDISFIASKPYDFAAPLDGLLPASTVSGYPQRVMSSCRVNGKIYCVQNDVAQNVLWYNAALMKQFGYAVPKTWEEYKQIGLRVAKEHPGYIIGALGSNTTQTYLWASRCPMHEPVAGGKLLINLKSPRCTRAVKMLDELLAAKAVTPLSEYAPGFTKKYAVPNKILMMVGASWFGQFMFHDTFKTPTGQTAAAAPLRWAGESTPWTGMIGGGIYMVSRHAADQKAAADIVNWIVTNPKYQDTAPTYPAYGPAAKSWLKKHEDGYFATKLGPPFKAAADAVYPGYGYVKFYESGIWSSAVVPAISKGETIASAIGDFENQLVQQAKINGYDVVRS